METYDERNCSKFCNMLSPNATSFVVSAALVVSSLGGGDGG